jgi:hypothetical protein
MQSEHVVLLIVAMPFNPRVYQLPVIQQPLFSSLPRPLLAALCPQPSLKSEYVLFSTCSSEQGA